MAVKPDTGRAGRRSMKVSLFEQVPPARTWAAISAFLAPDH
jgi:hypothetical protein